MTTSVSFFLSNPNLINLPGKLFPCFSLSLSIGPQHLSRLSSGNANRSLALILPFDTQNRVVKWKLTLSSVVQLLSWNRSRSRHAGKRIGLHLRITTGVERRFRTFCQHNGTADELCENFTSLLWNKKIFQNWAKQDLSSSYFLSFEPTDATLGCNYSLYLNLVSSFPPLWGYKNEKKRAHCVVFILRFPRENHNYWKLIARDGQFNFGQSLSKTTSTTLSSRISRINRRWLVAILKYRCNSHFTPNRWYTGWVKNLWECTERRVMQRDDFTILWIFKWLKCFKVLY